jgi:predicted phosphodiesterase
LAKINEELIELGLKKKADYAAGLKTPSWKELGEPYGLQGNDVRIMVQNYERRNGLLKGKYETGRDRILIISDLHIPDHKEGMILDIIKQNSKVNLIIMNGDILDCNAVSSWYDEHISILDYEMKIAHDLLTKIRSITNAKIVLVKGNHEQRVNKFYAANAKAMGTAVVETEILYKLANGFIIKDRKHPKIRTTYDAIPDVEYCDARSFLYGDLLCNHPSMFRKDNMKTVKVMWEEKLKNKYPEANVVVIGHTHQLGLIHYEDGRVLIEGGCTCEPAKYADQDDKPYKIQQYEYIYLEMKNKQVDINSIKMQYLGCDILPGNETEMDEEI